MAPEATIQKKSMPKFLEYVLDEACDKKEEEERRRDEMSVSARKMFTIFYTSSFYFFSFLRAFLLMKLL